MDTLKIAGSNQPDMPWEDRPAGSKEVMWRYSANPIIPRDALSTSNSIFNSAVIPFKKGKYNYAGVFRCDDTNRRMRIHAGFSVDGIDWDIREEDFNLVGGDAEISEWVYGYDPRVAQIGDKYYVTWCNGYHGPTIGIAWTDDFANVDSILDLKDTSSIKVYEQDTTDEANAGVNDLNKTGKDVTDQFDITAEGTKVTVSAKDSYEAAQKDLKTAKQISVVIPFDVNFDTVKLLESYGKAEGDELNTCADPKGDDLDNKGGQTVGGSTVDTNTPKICVTVPPIHKQVIAESSQGGDQSSIDTQVVFPGQTVEYTVLAITHSAN